MYRTKIKSLKEWKMSASRKPLAFLDARIIMRKITFFIATMTMLFASCASRKDIQKDKGELSDEAYLDSASVDLTAEDSLAVEEDTVVTIPQVAFVLHIDAEQRDSDHYTCDYTWDGMGAWFDEALRKDEERIALLQDSIIAHAEGKMQRKALEKEVRSWKALTKAFDKMVDGQGDLGFTSGQGSASMENARWAKVMLRCYRCLCLEEDYLSFTDDYEVKKMTVSTSKLFAYMDKRVKWLDVNNIDKEELRGRRGGVAQYKRELAACKRDVEKAKAAFNAWIGARQAVRSCLKGSVGTAYQRDTQKLLNSLAEGF